METNEIMTNEDVIEVAEEIIPTTSENGISVGIAIGAAVVAGGIAAYKYIVKPLVANVKDKKNKQEDSNAPNDTEDVKNED